MNLDPPAFRSARHILSGTSSSSDDPPPFRPSALTDRPPATILKPSSGSSGGSSTQFGTATSGIPSFSSSAPFSSLTGASLFSSANFPGSTSGIPSFSSSVQETSGFPRFSSSVEETSGFPRFSTSELSVSSEVSEDRELGILGTLVGSAGVLVPLAAAVAALFAHNFLGVAPAKDPELTQAVANAASTGQSNEGIATRAYKYIKSFWSSGDEAKEVIKQSAPTLAGHLSDLGFGGALRNSTALGEAFWDAGEPRRATFNLQATEMKRRPAKHNFVSGKLTISAAQPFNGAHTLEQL